MNFIMGKGIYPLTKQNKTYLTADSKETNMSLCDSPDLSLDQMHNQKCTVFLWTYLPSKHHLDLH